MSAPIYLDHNATTPVRAEVLEAMRPYLEEEFGNAASLHRAGQRAKAAIERARGTCAAVLGCDPAEILFTSGGTEGNNLALRGAAWGARERGRRIVCAEIEHASVRETVRALGAQGFEPVFVPVPIDGAVELTRFEAALDGPTVLAALMYANNESGVVQPIAKAARACRARGVVFHVDAVQAAGKLPIEVGELGCDTLALSAHKFEGPKGAGLLYVRAGIRLDSPMTGGSHERSLRGGTPNTAGIVGTAEALRLAEAERAGTAKRIGARRDLFERLLREGLPDAAVVGAKAQRVCNTSFTAFPGRPADSLVMALDLEGVAASTGAACAEGANVPSHVLEAMGVPESWRRSAVRFSLGRTTTEEEVRAAVERTIRVVARLK